MLKSVGNRPLIAVLTDETIIHQLIHDSSLRAKLRENDINDFGFSSAIKRICRCDENIFIIFLVNSASTQEWIDFAEANFGNKKFRAICDTDVLDPPRTISCIIEALTSLRKEFPELEKSKEIHTSQKSSGGKNLKLLKN